MTTHEQSSPLAEGEEGGAPRTVEEAEREIEQARARMTSFLHTEVLLKDLYEQDAEKLTRARKHLDAVYTWVPEVLDWVSRATGHDPFLVLRACRRATWASDIPWYEFLLMVRDFSTAAKQIGEEDVKRAQVARRQQETIEILAADKEGGSGGTPSSDTP